MVACNLQSEVISAASSHEEYGKVLSSSAADAYVHSLGSATMLSKKRQLSMSSLSPADQFSASSGSMGNMNDFHTAGLKHIKTENLFRSPNSSVGEQPLKTDGVKVFFSTENRDQVVEGQPSSSGSGTGLPDVSSIYESCSCAKVQGNSVVLKNGGKIDSLPESKSFCSATFPGPFELARISTAMHPHASRKKYLGVRARGKNRWVAEIKDNNHSVRKWLGTFACPVEAARAFDAAARAIRGPDAKTNFRVGDPEYMQELEQYYGKLLLSSTAHLPNASQLPGNLFSSPDFSQDGAGSSSSRLVFSGKPPRGDMDRLNHAFDAAAPSKIGCDPHHDHVASPTNPLAEARSVLSDRTMFGNSTTEKKLTSLDLNASNGSFVDDTKSSSTWPFVSAQERGTQGVDMPLGMQGVDIPRYQNNNVVMGLPFLHDGKNQRTMLLRGLNGWDDVSIAKAAFRNGVSPGSEMCSDVSAEVPVRVGNFERNLTEEAKPAHHRPSSCLPSTTLASLGNDGEGLASPVEFRFSSLWEQVPRFEGAKERPESTRVKTRMGSLHASQYCRSGSKEYETNGIALDLSARSRICFRGGYGRESGQGDGNSALMELPDAILSLCNNETQDEASRSFSVASHWDKRFSTPLSLSSLQPNPCVDQEFAKVRTRLGLKLVPREDLADLDLSTWRSVMAPS